MKDLTSTSFGLVIAYLLPGVCALYGLASVYPEMGKLFSGFLTAPSTGGLFFLVVLLAGAAGLEVTAVRWLVYECLLCNRSSLKKEEFAALSMEGTLAAFTAATDAHYRYHQFWGGMSIVLPLYAKEAYTRLLESGLCPVLDILTLLGFETITVVAAVVAYLKYVERAREIMKGVRHA